MTEFATDPRVAEFRRVSETVVPMSVRQAAETGFVEYMLESAPPHMHQVVLRVLAREGFLRDSLRDGANLTDEQVAGLPAADSPDDRVAALRAMPYTEYLKTQHWHFVRQAALQRAGHTCAVCDSSDRLEVHHRTYERRGCEWPEDLVVLCNGCHSRQHGILDGLAA